LGIFHDSSWPNFSIRPSDFTAGAVKPDAFLRIAALLALIDPVPCEFTNSLHFAAINGLYDAVAEIEAVL
jgi:hypothetical protein